MVVGVLAIPGRAMAQSYVPTPGDDPVVLKSLPIDPGKPAPTTPVTTVAPAAVVEGVQIAQPVTSPVAVKGVQLSAGSTPAFTGSNQTRPFVAASGIMLVAGGLLVAANRRRRKPLAN